jgi:hypothetical protein
MVVTFLSNHHLLLCFKNKCSPQIFSFPAVCNFIFRVRNWAWFGSETESSLHSFLVVSILRLVHLTEGSFCASVTVHASIHRDSTGRLLYSVSPVEQTNMGTRVLHIQTALCSNIGLVSEYPNRFQWLFSPCSLYRAFGLEVDFLFSSLFLILKKIK